MSDWQEIDRNLRNSARQRMLLDADEARWLRAAVAEELHLHVGCLSMVEYLEQVCGYTPKVAVERLRIAEKLEALPGVEAELRAGRMMFSAVREVTRVATPETEPAWIAASVGKTVHEVQAMVSGRRPGDLPSDPATPDLETQILRFEVSTATVALYRQATRVLEDELGTQLNDNEIIAVMCRTVLEGRAANDGEAQGRAPHQVVFSVCERCEAGQQLAGGVAFDVHPNVVAKARCDAQHVGHVDGGAPARAKQEVSPAVRRMVLLRDGQRCRVPWCRSARHLEAHHIKYWSHGGSNAPHNLVTLCGFHHDQHHDGRLTLIGQTASSVTFERVEPHVGLPREELDRMTRELMPQGMSLVA